MGRCLGQGEMAGLSHGRRGGGIADGNHVVVLPEIHGRREALRPPEASGQVQCPLSGYLDRLQTNKLGFKLGIPVLEEHGYHFTEVFL